MFLRGDKVSMGSWEDIEFRKGANGSVSFRQNADLEVDPAAAPCVCPPWNELDNVFHFRARRTALYIRGWQKIGDTVRGNRCVHRVKIFGSVLWIVPRWRET
jgi:hypothetical protein